MKNLAHIPVEELELSPTQTGIRWFKRGGYGHMNKLSRRWRERHKHGNGWEILNSRITRIIEASVGKNWDEVYSRLRDCMVGITFDFSLDRTIGWMVTKPVWSYRNQRWEVTTGGRRYGELVALTDYIQEVKEGKFRYHRDFLYICPKSNMLRLVVARPKHEREDPSRFRTYYQKLTQIRKEHKEKRQRSADARLAMINNPQLYQFYIKMLSERESIRKKIEKYETEKSPDRNATYLTRVCWKWGKPKLEDFERLNHLERDIAELEAGHYDVFFESAVYLYSQHKECHHFKTP